MTPRTALSRSLAALALALGVAGAAQAQWLGQDYANYGAPLSSFGASNFS